MSIEPESSYKKRITYNFKVCGTELEVVDFGEDFITIREVRNNGQEDTHMVGTIILVGNGYYWENTPTMFSRYGSEKLEDAIIEFVRINGFPKED